MTNKLFVCLKIVVIASILLIVFSVFPSASIAFGETEEGNKKVDIMVTVREYTREHSRGWTLLRPVPGKDLDVLKHHLLFLEQRFSGLNRIREQTRVLSNTLDFNVSMWGNPAVLTFNNYSGFTLNWSIPVLTRILGGLMLVSHFTPDGCVTGSCFPFKPWFYNTSLFYSHKNTQVNGVVGVLPWYVGFSFSEVHVTAVGLTSKGLVVSKTFSPFFEVLIPCTGTSIRVYEKKNDSLNILFEYNLDLCLVGLLTGLEVESFSS